jgi:hypothetical protein
MDSSAPELFNYSSQGCGPSVPQLPLTGYSVHVVIGHLPEAKDAKFARDLEIGLLVEE